jgi:hypothetical protein
MIVAMDTLHDTTAASPSPRRKLPIGLQTFAKLREDGCYYVDKTGLACDMVASGTAFFLSRPRRFGKSLLVDTLKELFEGNRALFSGLAADARWDWSRSHPVIRISFGGGRMRDRTELEQRIAEMLDEHRERLGLDSLGSAQTLTGRFAALIRLARQRHGQRVVVLIDEYDKSPSSTTSPAPRSPVPSGMRCRACTPCSRMPTSTSSSSSSLACPSSARSACFPA